MNYHIYEFNFSSGVHFGINSLDDTDFTFESDRLFSALCIEALKMGNKQLDTLIEYVRTGKLLFSDAFPMVDGEYYLPKPMIKIKHEDGGDSKAKKAFKKMKYIPLSIFDAYLRGEMTGNEAEKIKMPGHKVIKVSAAISGNDEADPFRVGTHYFEENEALYIIVKTGSGEIKRFMEELIDGLSLIGIGGKRSSGLGKFEYYHKMPDKLMLDRLEAESDVYMSLSGSLPRDEEIEKSMENAEYTVSKKSGFVSSTSYSESFMRKRDLYIFNSGSCFKNRFEGDIYDVSSQGSHPVYRYAKPLFMGVEI